MDGSKPFQSHASRTGDGFAEASREVEEQEVTLPALDQRFRSVQLGIDAASAGIGPPIADEFRAPP